MDGLNLTTSDYVWVLGPIVYIAICIVWTRALYCAAEKAEMTAAAFIRSEPGAKCLLYFVGIPLSILLITMYKRIFGLPHSPYALWIVTILCWAGLFGGVSAAFMREVLRGGLKPLIDYVTQIVSKARY